MKKLLAIIVAMVLISSFVLAEEILVEADNIPVEATVTILENSDNSQEIILVEAVPTLTAEELNNVESSLKKQAKEINAIKSQINNSIELANEASVGSNSNNSGNNQSTGNQTTGNQTTGNQSTGNQTTGNQSIGNQSNVTMSPKGLTNALLRVKNENARARIQRNLERFQERYTQRFQNMSGVELEDLDEETGELTIKAKEQVRYFGFIKGKATKRFNVNVQGKIEERAPWYRFLYADSN